MGDSSGADTGVRGMLMLGLGTEEGDSAGTNNGSAAS